MKQLLLSFILFNLLLSCCYGVNEFRYGTISWTRSPDDPLYVTLTVETAYIYDPSLVSDDTITSSRYSINWGDGTFTPNIVKLLEVNRYINQMATSWMLARATAAHRYATSTQYTIGWSQCCRPSNIADNNNGGIVRLIARVNLTETLYTSPKISFHPWMAFRVGSPRTFIAPVQFMNDEPFVFTYQSGDLSLLSSLVPAGFSYANFPMLSWTAPFAGQFVTQFKAYYPAYPTSWVVCEISLQAIAVGVIMPNPPELISITGADFDGYNISAGPGETITMIVQSSSSNSSASTNVEWSAWPINTTVSDCAEGTKTGAMRPFSISNTCTRTFTWTVNSYEKNYDITLMSRDENMVGSDFVQYLIKVVPPKPIITEINPTSWNVRQSGYLTITGTNLNEITAPATITIGNKGCLIPEHLDDTHVRCQIPWDEGKNYAVVIHVNDRESEPFFGLSRTYTALTRDDLYICPDFYGNCGACTSIHSKFTDGFDSPKGTATCEFCLEEGSYIYETCTRKGGCGSSPIYETPAMCDEDWPIDPCMSYSSSGCESCTSHTECGWCGTIEEGTGMCISGNEYGPLQGMCSAELGGWRYHSYSTMKCGQDIVTEYFIDLLSNPSQFSVNDDNTGITNFWINDNQIYYFRIMSSDTNRLEFSEGVRSFIDDIRPTTDQYSTAVGYATIQLPSLEEYFDLTGETSFNITNVAFPDTMVLTFNLLNTSLLPVVTSVSPIVVDADEVITIFGENLPRIFDGVTITVGNDTCTDLTLINDGAAITCTIDATVFGFQLPVVLHDNRDRNTIPMYISIYDTHLERFVTEICDDYTGDCAACTSVKSIHWEHYDDSTSGSVSCDYCKDVSSEISEQCVPKEWCITTGFQTPEECVIEYPTIDPCSEYSLSGCNSCTSVLGCGWCGREEEGTGMCISGDGTGPSSITCSNEIGGWIHQNASVLSSCNITEFVVDLFTNTSEIYVNGINNKTFDIQDNNKYYFRILSNAFAPIRMYSAIDYIDDLQPPVIAYGAEYSIIAGYIVITLPSLEEYFDATGETSFTLKNIAYPESMFVTFNITSEPIIIISSSSSSSTGEEEEESSSSSTAEDEEPSSSSTSLDIVSSSLSSTNDYQSSTISHSSSGIYSSSSSSSSSGSSSSSISSTIQLSSSSSSSSTGQEIIIINTHSPDEAIVIVVSIISSIVMITISVQTLQIVMTLLSLL